MKKSILMLITLLALVVPTFVHAQKPDAELTKDEAVVRIQELEASVMDLTNKVAAMNGDIEKLKKEIEDTKRALKECRDSYYSLLGATPDDIEKYRQSLGQIEGKVRAMARLSDDELADKKSDVEALEAELNAMRMNKIACIAEFYNKIIALARDIKGLYKEKKIKSYTVGTWAENRDCLWNIAGKTEIYGDPFQWPKIWQGNTEQIKNPDIIHPGQVLKLPPAGPKTPEEMKAERKYWRNKRAAMEAKAENAEQKKGE